MFDMDFDVLVLSFAVSRTMCGENSVHYWETPYAQPFFDNTTKRDVTATVGQPALLHCRVRNLGDRAVSRVFFFTMFHRLINTFPVKQFPFIEAENSYVY